MTASTTSLTTSLQVPQAPALRTARDSFWTRIAAELAEAIGSGVYPPGQRLPSEHALAEQFGVNRHTIRRSLASLCSQGLVRITQGSGTYVEDFAVDLVLGKRTRHQQGLAQAGLRGSLVVLGEEAVRATAALAKALQVPARSPLRDSDRCGADDKRCCTGPLCGERVEKVSACFGWSGPESCVRAARQRPEGHPCTGG